MANEEGKPAEGKGFTIQDRRRFSPDTGEAREKVSEETEGTSRAAMFIWVTTAAYRMSPRLLVFGASFCSVLPPPSNGRRAGEKSRSLAVTSSARPVRSG